MASKRPPAPAPKSGSRGGAKNSPPPGSKEAKYQARIAKVEAFRKKEEQRSQRRILFIVAGAVACAIAVAFVIVDVANTEPKAGTIPDASGQIIPAAVDSSPTTTQMKVTSVANTSGIDGVLAWNTTGWPGDGTAHAGALEHQHVIGPVDYSILPPVGGPHNAIWMNAGVYTKPVPTERAVHNLEHGAVWITYDPDLSKADVKALTAFVTKQTMIAEPSSNVSGQANRYMDLSPWAKNDLPSKIVISAWGRQLRVTSPTDPRLQKFVDTFRHNATYTPEYGAAVDGVPVQTGGVPATDGSAKANPAGTAS